MEQELTVEEQRQAAADMNLGMQLAIDERDLNARAELQKRGSEIAKNIADERRQRQVDAIAAKAASSDAATQARADEAHAEAEGAPLTPGDDVAKAAAAGQAAEAEKLAEVEAEPDAESKGPDVVVSPAKDEAEHTVAVEGPNQGLPGTRAEGVE